MHETPLRSRVQPPLLDQIAEYFTLSDAQIRYLRGLADDHSRNFSEFVKASREVSDTYNDKLMRTRVSSIARMEIELERESALAEIADEQARLDEQFFEALLPILSDTQREKWDEFIQQFNRQRWLRGDTFLEQSVDIVVIVEKLAEATGNTIGELGVSELLTQYSFEMDQRLVACATALIRESRHWHRNLSQRYETDGDQYWVGQHPQGNDGFRREYRERRRLFEHIRDVNRRYFDIIYTSLPEEHRFAFRQAYLERIIEAANFRGANSLRFHHIAQCAANLENLTTDQYESLESLTAHYDASFELAVQELNHRTDQVAIDAIFSDQQRRQHLEQRLEQAVNRLRNLDEQSIEQIHDLLDPDQSQAVKSGEACAGMRN